MSYAIGYVVYGIDLTERSALERALPVEMYADLEDNPESLGLESAYSASGEAPLWFGLTLTEIDECNTVRVEDLTKYLNSPVIHSKWEAKLSKLDPEIREAIFTGYSKKPELLIIWGSS